MSAQDVDTYEAETQLRRERVLSELIRSSSEVRFRANADWSTLRELTGGDFIADTANDDPSWLEAYIPALDRDAVRAEIARAVSEKSTYLIEHLVNRVDGSVGWALSRAVPLLDDAGEIIEWYGAATDITERKQAEAALRESESRYRNMADRAPVMMWVTDPNDYCTHLNARWYEFTGQEPRAGEGYGWLDAIHPEDRQAAELAYLSANAEQRDYRVDFRLRRADGEYRWTIDAAAARFDEDGQFLGYVGSVFDIDERREEQERLALKEEQLRLATDIGDIGEWDVDHLTGAMFWPPRVKAMFGISADVPVTLEDFHNGVYPDDREATRAAYEATSDPALRTPYDVEYRTVGKEDGLIRWVAAKGQGLFDAEGACFRVIGTAIDVTERKRAEEQLRELNETLETRVAEAVAEREVVQDALRQSQKIEAIGQLTGGVAHDFNNLLTVIRGSVDLLRRPNLTPERREKYIDAIGETADRAAKLTSQLLAFARRQALTPELFDIGASIDQVGNMVRTLAGSRIQLELKAPRQPLFVLADRSQLDTAIVNLAINARDAMNGEGKLTIAIGAVSNVPARRGHETILGDFVAVAVLDEGSGIAEADLDRIFEPFFTTKPAGHGTGLGLSQVIGFAKQSGGDVKAESTLGKGTSFTLYLPRVEPDDAARPELVTEDTTRGEGSCILVVEDNADVGEFAAGALKELGYDSILAPDAVHALTELQKDSARFHVVFSDVVMPGMSGIELAQHVRREYPAIPVILTSGYSHVLAENGTYGFELLHKPYSIDQLSRVLQKAIRWAKAKRAVD